jgi:predicted Zn-dependent protease
MANAALIFAACDDRSQAQSLRDELLKQYPQNTFLASIISPLVDAHLEAKRGNIDRALQLLESLRNYDLGTLTGVSVNYMRGKLYLEQGRGNEAAAEFRTIESHPYADPLSPAHALARLGLARALKINGDTAGARKAYQDFFAFWKDADADLPALIKARKEYEQLSS